MQTQASAPVAIIQAFYDAIVAKDAAAICGHYVPDEHTYVVLEGPRLTTLGYAKIAKGWGDFCQSGLALTSIEWLEGPLTEETAGMAWVGGVIRLAVTVRERAFTQTFRATFVLRRVDGIWKIRHEHVSGALADPYGIGDWLKASEE